MASLTTQLYDPLLRYHHKGKGEPSFAEESAAKLDAINLGRQVTFNSNVRELLKSLGTPTNGVPAKDTTKLSDAIITKWKNDPTGDFIKNLDADLAKDPDAAKRLVAAIKADPNKVAQNISTYQPGKLAASIPAEFAAPPVQAAPAAAPAANAPATAQPGATKPVATPKTQTPAPPSKSTAPAELYLAPGEELVTRDTPKAPVRPPSSPKDKEIEDQLSKGIFEGLADESNENIIKAIDADLVKSIAKAMSADAVTKYGVSPATADAFAKKIAGSDDPKDQAGYDPQLSEDIAANLKRNPDFVRQLAKSSKDKTPLTKEMQDMAKGTMTSVMENPEKLKEDAYVKNLSRQMNSASTLGGIGKMFGSLFGEGFGAKISGWFGQIIESIKNFFSGFMGKSVLSVNSNGNSLFPSVMANMGNFADNQADAAALARKSPDTMKALPIAGADGKIFHDVVIGKNDKGEDIKRQEPNTITLKTADGKDVKAIPAGGDLVAKQMKGQFDPAGNFMEANYRVPIVVAIDKDGNSTKLAMVEMTPKAFREYQAQVDAEAAKRGKSFSLRSENYTAQDAIAAGTPPGLQILSVDAKTGAVSDPVEVPLARPVVQTVPSNVSIVDQRNLPANDPAYSLQA